MRILIVNGPNLNLLGTRETGIYGSTTLEDLEARWRRHANDMGIGLTTFQSNHEGDIIDALHGARDRCDGVVINPGAFSHYSYAIYDALVAIDLPIVEVHISNIYEREPWRHVSVTSAAADAVIYGRGVDGYIDAMELLAANIVSPPTRVPYGEGTDHVGDLRLPDREGSVPLAIVVHGGFWRDIYQRDIMAPLAAALHTRGWATYVVEYTRGPGSFPAAPDDVATAVRHVVTLLQGRDVAVGPIVAIGHSAGGYLALREAHTGSMLDGVVALAPVTDLTTIGRSRPDDDPAVAFVGSEAGSDPETWQRALLTGEPSCAVRLVHGSNDTTVPVAQSTAYVELHPELATLIELEGTDHMELIQPRTAAFDAVLDAMSAFSS